MSCQSRFDARYWMLGAGALKFQELVMDREALHAAVHGVAKPEWLNWTELNWTALLMWHHVLPTRLSSILESQCAGSMLGASSLSILQVDIELSDYIDHYLLSLELEESVRGDCCIRQIWVKGNILSSVLLQLTCQFCLFLKWMFSWIACPFLLQKYRHLLHNV